MSVAVQTEKYTVHKPVLAKPVKPEGDLGADSLESESDAVRINAPRYWRGNHSRNRTDFVVPVLSAMKTEPTSPELSLRKSFGSSLHSHPDEYLSRLAEIEKSGLQEQFSGHIVPSLGLSEISGQQDSSSEKSLSFKFPCGF